MDNASPNGWLFGVRMGVEKEALVFGLLFTAIIICLTLRFGPVDWWGAYYYRNAQTTLEQGTTLYYDELSYLGRNFTYPPAFFELGSELALLLGVTNYESIRLPFHFFTVFIYSLSLYLLFRNFKSIYERIAGVSIFATHAFVMIFSSTVTPHVLAYALMNISLLLFESKERILKFLAVFLLSLALSTHPTSIVLFPIYIYATGMFKIDWKRFENAALTLLSASIISLIFYLPIFIQNGLPYEIVPTLWGYMLSYGVVGLVYDLQFLLPLIFLTFLFGITRKNLVLPSLLLLTAVLADAFVTYRANLVVTALLSFLFPIVFGEKLKDAVFMAVFSLFIFANLIFVPVLFSGTTWWCTWVYANDMCIKPMQFIEKFTSTSENVAINPEYGHLEAYIGKRKVLADLYVEYAASDKFYAEYNFYQKSNATYLEGYNISIFVLDDMGMTRNMPEMDRIYDNSFIHMYRRR